jgi:predicted nucleic acid-binding protein
LGSACGELGRIDADIMIAAMALEHGLVVATLNVGHFKSTDADIINPYHCS